MSDLDRREFIQFLGRSAALAAAASTLPLLSCVSTSKKTAPPFQPIAPSSEDKLTLAEGLSYELLLRWGQRLNSQGQTFGFNNDYLAYIPLDPRNPLEGLLWVNHEYHDPFYCSGWQKGQPRTLAQINKERRDVGGSIVHIRKTSSGSWEAVLPSKYNRRLDAFTPIPLIADEPILGKRTGIGTFANCAGGVTPWGTILTCEENYMNFIGEVSFENGTRNFKPVEGYLSWNSHLKLPPEHYGWVVEVDLRTGKAKKLTALGRFAHECATTIVASDRRTVVYTGDDAEDEHLYKFISSQPGSLEKGELFVADTHQGRWISLSLKNNEQLRKHFKSQTEVLIRAREAARLVGATPLDRPEDIEIDPQTRSVIVALSNNKKQKRPYGSLLRIEELNGDPLSMTFKASTYVAGGPESGFACPDNLAFDPSGNLWMCTDISGSSMARPPYDVFGNNGLFYIPLSGANAGRAFQVASAPNGAEFTGPIFTPDGTLLLSVQHPGERAHDKGYRESHWPDGGNAPPAPCVIQIRGPTLERLLAAPNVT